jgi:hypothetical protein
MQRPITPIPIAWLLISLVAAGGVLAQQAPTSVPLSIPPGPVTHFPTRYDVTDAPEHFRQVLPVVDLPTGAWTPPLLNLVATCTQP